MVISFWVHGRGIGEPESLSRIRSAWRWSATQTRGLGEKIGLLDPPAEEQKTVVPEKEEPKSSSWSLFRGLGPRREERKVEKLPPGTYKVGEVRGDYVKVSSLLLPEPLS